MSFLLSSIETTVSVGYFLYAVDNGRKRYLKNDGTNGVVDWTTTQKDAEIYFCPNRVKLLAKMKNLCVEPLFDANDNLTSNNPLTSEQYMP